MIFALAKFSSFFADFNRRSLTENDFFEICEKELVAVVFEEMPILQGFTAKLKSRNYIFLDRDLHGLNFLWIAFHELAHYVLHEPRPRCAASVKFYSLCRPNAQEDEADAVALVAIYPTTCLEDLQISAPSEYPFERDLISKRLAIYETFRI